MRPSLLLNATFEPISVISWKKAIILTFLGKAEVITAYEQAVHAVSMSMNLPAVLRLIHYVKYRRHEVKFTRRNIYIRDKYRCQYCGKGFEPKDLTYDHVIPKSGGGKTTWENVVTCCHTCNLKKGGRTPKEAGMRLLNPPVEPRWHPMNHFSMDTRQIPAPWLDYLIWHPACNPPEASFGLGDAEPEKFLQQEQD